MMRQAVWFGGILSLVACVDGEKDAGNAPDCSITAPEDGSLATEGASIRIEGTAEGDGSLTITLSSDLDGDLGAVAYSEGTWAMSTIGLSAGAHQLSLAVSNAEGTCEAQSGITVGNAPTVFITAPALGATIGNAGPSTFSATVSDDIDAPSDISIVWEHDSLGVFGEASADADGVALATLDGLTAGEHTVSVTATDSGGFSASNEISFFVDDSPTTPEVQITPAAPTSSDVLTAEILTKSVDPDGSKVSYRYLWLRDGADSGVFAPTLSQTETARDEVWTLQIFPSDGVAEGLPGEAQVTIENSPPTPPAVSISPAEPTDEDALLCGIDKPAFDADSDEVTYTVSWTVDGTSHTGTTETTTLPGDTIPITELIDGEEWRCVVETDDGYAAGAAATSEPVTISPSIIIYDIDSTMLNGLVNDCSSSGNAPYNNCSGDWGFTWTSSGARAPSSMTITMPVGVWCSTSASIDLNGTVIDTISPTYDCACSPTEKSLSIKTTKMSSYNEGGSNTITVTGGTSCEGLIASGTLGTDIHASVEVDY